MKHPESFPANAAWYTKLTNMWPLMIDDESVHTIAIAWLFKDYGWIKQKRWPVWILTPRLVKENWQYTNAVFSIRIGLPIALFVHIRWSDNPQTTRQFLQAGFGYKQSGRFAVHFRLQTDASAQTGYHEGMPNNGQAQGFDYGGK